MFISFEGPEGSGKSTQGRLLADWLTRQGRPLLLTYEPGGTPLGEAIRRILLDTDRRVPVGARAEALLFAAARTQLVEDVIEPALRRGETVICDRYIDSTIAYQCGGRGLPLADVEEVLRFATNGLTPDLTFLLDLDVSVGLSRKSGSNRDRLEQEALTFHEKVRRAYLDRAARYPNRIVVLNAQRPVEELSKEIRDQLGRLTVAERDAPRERSNP